MEPLPDVPITILLPYNMLEENIVALTYFQAMRQDGARHMPASLYFAQRENFLEFARKSIGGTPNPNSAQIKSARLLKGDTTLLDPASFADPNAGPFGKNRYDQLEANHFKGLTDRYHLQGEPGGSLTLAFDVALDISNREVLSIYYNYANSEKRSLSFTVRLEDMEGQWETCQVSGVSPFNYGADCLIPFYQERIDLDKFQAVDLTSIISIALIFEDGIEGELNLGDISLSGYKDAPCGEY